MASCCRRLVALSQSSHGRSKPSRSQSAFCTRSNINASKNEVTSGQRIVRARAPSPGIDRETGGQARLSLDPACHALLSTHSDCFIFALAASHSFCVISVKP